jgi:tetratricopeptide (TPR) repeat protein
MYRLVGKAADAIPLLERVRDAKVKQLGPDDPSTLSTLDKLAEAYHAAGKTAEAIDLYVQVREARVKYFEADHPETLSTSNGLAMTYLAAGRTTDAIALLEQVRDAQARKLEPDHPNALSVLDNLATAYRIDGRTNEAIALHQKVLDARLKALTAEHPETLRTMNNLAVAYQFAGKIEPSLPFLQRAAAGAEKRRFVDETAGQIVKNLIMTLEALNQHPPAETWRRKWLAVVKERSGPRSLAFGAELASLGSNLLKQKKYAEAEPIVRQGLAVFQARDPDAWGTFCTRSLLGGALLGQKRYDEAEPLLLDGYAGMKQRQARVAAAGTVQLTDALQRLVRLYDARGKPDEAARWRKELEKAKAPPKPN